MAFQIHMERPSTGKVWDVITLGDVTVTKSISEPTSLQCKFMRDAMTVENGDIIAVQLNEEGKDDFNLFYGYVQNTSKFYDEVTVTAYDQLYFFKLSKEFKSYGTKKASDLYIQICDEHKFFMLDPPMVVDTEYTIPNIICDGASLLDLMVEALNISNVNTGKNFYMYDFFRNLCIGESELHKIPHEEYELNEENIISYSYDEDGSQRYNEVIVKSNDDKYTDMAVRRDEESIKRYGAISLHYKIKDGENADVIANELFEENRVIPITMTVEVLGCNPQVYPGRKIYVDLTPIKEYIRGWFIVESVTYTLKSGSGDMNIKLKFDKMEL